MATKVNIKRSMASHRTYVNNAIKRAEKFIADHPNGLTNSHAHKTAEEQIDEIKEYLASMKKKWTDVFLPQLEVDDPDSLLDVWDNTVQDISNQAKNTIDELGKGIETFLTSGAAASTASTTTNSRKELKVNTTFKPQILPRSTNLEEFHTWEKNFKGYHEMNKAFLAAATPDMRQLFITSLLDTKLQSALSNDKTITLGTPLIANGTEESILSWIKAYLPRHTPLFVRRYEYAMCRQKPKESFEDYWDRKLIKAKQKIFS